MITSSHIREILQHDNACRGYEKSPSAPQIQLFADKLGKFRVDAVEFSRKAMEMVENLGASRLTLKHLTDLAAYMRQEVVTQERIKHQLPSDDGAEKKLNEKRKAAGLVKVVTDWNGSQASTKWVHNSRAHKLGESMSILKADFCTIVLGLIATDLLKQGKSLEEVYQLALRDSKGWKPSQLLYEVQKFIGYHATRRVTQVVVNQDKFEALTQQVLSEREQRAWAF